jgi:RND family efflux transporter MFP subunit
VTVAIYLTALCVPQLIAGTRVGAETAVPVRVVQPVPAETAETLRLTGSVTTQRRAGLSPRISGLVTAVHVDAGDRVEQGDVLLEMDSVLARLVLERDRAALVEARTRLAEAKRLRDEAVPLVRDKHLPPTEGHAREANVKLGAAAVARLDAEVREAEELVARHTVVAPFAGVISRKHAEAGEWVQTGTPVLDLVSIEHLRVDVQVPQERFAEIDEDVPVTVRLDGARGRTFPGRVIAKVPVHDPGARTFLVRVGIENADGRAVPGMSAQAFFAIPGHGDALAVPRDALVRQPDGTYRIWIVEGSGDDRHASSRNVVLGRAMAETVEVVEGLDAERPVIVRGNERLREGQLVRVLGGE